MIASPVRAPVAAKARLRSRSGRRPEMSAAPPRVALTPAGSSRRCHSRGRLHLREAGIGPAQPPTGHPHRGRGRKITRPGPPRSGPRGLGDRLLRAVHRSARCPVAGAGLPAIAVSPDPYRAEGRSRYRSGQLSARRHPAGDSQRRPVASTPCGAPRTGPSAHRNPHRRRSRSPQVFGDPHSVTSGCRIWRLTSIRGRGFRWSRLRPGGPSRSPGTRATSPTQ